jgi:hypothetical protein
MPLACRTAGAAARQRLPGRGETGEDAGRSEIRDLEKKRFHCSDHHSMKKN